MKRVVSALLLTTVVACSARKEISMPEVIAHRGFWNAAEPVPHNSVAALENAIELGCFGAEFDIWLTSDDVPVVFHDHITSGGVIIKDVSYSELMERDGRLANGENIPTLEEYLAAWEKSDKRVKLIFEIKSHGTPERDRDAAVKVHQIAAAHRIAPERMEYITFSRDVCKALTGMDTGVPVAYLEGDLSPAEARERLEVTGIDYNIAVLKKHPEWIAEAHELGMTVNVWTLVSPEDMQYFVDAGVDYITTDAPDVLTELLNNL